MKNLKLGLLALTLMFAFSLSAQKKISQLPELITPDNTDVLPIVNDGVTKKITVANLLNAASGGYTSKTFDELIEAKDNKELSQGSYYLMADYQTIYAQPDYYPTGGIKSALVIKTGSVEPLLLFAISDSSFAPEAYSLIFPKDKLLYDINVDTTFNYMGATNSAPTKGRIYERIDENNNRTDFDHRVVEFIRYDDGNGNYTVVKYNGNTAQEFLSFDIAQSFNNYFASTYSLSQFENREFGNNVFHGFLLDNEFSSSISNNTFSGDVVYNTFSGGVGDNIFSGDVGNNIFSGGVFINTFSGEVSTNIFSGDMNTNTFIGDVYYNTFIGEVHNNTFTHTNPLQYVTIESLVGNRTITETLYPNLFGTDYTKELLLDSATSDVYFKTESPSSVTPITYTIIP